MKRIPLFVAAIGAVVLLRGAARRRRPGTLKTQAGEPISDEALMTDVGESIAPERPETKD
jgi:hypothetical protein